MSCMLLLQEVRENYKLWYEDDMSLLITFEATSESAVELKLDHEKKESWEIFSLIKPPKVQK